jgi:hypothetical protein
MLKQVKSGVKHNDVYCMEITFFEAGFNPKWAGGGVNQPLATLKACHFVWDEIRTIKPSCNFHFGYLENERYKFWGLFMKMFINFEF